MAVQQHRQPKRHAHPPAQPVVVQRAPRAQAGQQAQRQVEGIDAQLLAVVELERGHRHQQRRKQCGPARPGDAAHPEEDQRNRRDAEQTRQKTKQKIVRRGSDRQPEQSRQAGPGPDQRGVHGWFHVLRGVEDLECGHVAAEIKAGTLVVPEAVAAQRIEPQSRPQRNHCGKPRPQRLFTFLLALPACFHQSCSLLAGSCSNTVSMESLTFTPHTCNAAGPAGPAAKRVSAYEAMLWRQTFFGFGGLSVSVMTAATRHAMPAITNGVNHASAVTVPAAAALFEAASLKNPAICGPTMPATP